MVAPGTVKSRMPSALADIDQRSADSFTPLAGSPASTPASLPRNSEPGASSAPASTAPLVSEITRVSARPIRPPAPATIKRISAMAIPLSALLAGAASSGNRELAGLLGLRAVIALDDDQIRHRVRLAHLDVGLVFRRVVAGERGRIVGKFDDDVARAAVAFDAGEGAAPNHITRAEFLEDRRIGERVRLVAFFVVNVDASDPVSFCRHACSPAIC